MDGYALLADNVEEHNTVYQEIDYKYYVLTVNQGEGEESPHFCDDIRVLYEGSTLGDEVFDSRLLEPTVFNLVNLVRGWSLVMPHFKESAGFIENGDGTVSYDNPGLGIMFIPSGLGYFSNALTDLPAYSPLIFKFELLETEIADHDNDGVPSYLEDISEPFGEFNINSGDDTDDDDTDDDGTPDFADDDDDNDGVKTINEDLNNDGDPTNDDGDNDGVPSYLDPTETTEIVVMQMVTPNGDGKNEFLWIENVDKALNNSLKIFNRWGVEVYAGEDYNNQNNVFDGRSKGRSTVSVGDYLPAGVYFYIFDYNTVDNRNVTDRGYIYISK